MNKNINQNQVNSELSRVIETLTFLKLYNSKISNLLQEISILSENQVFDFQFMERGLRKILLKKGDKNKNIQEYFTNIKNSLSKRNRIPKTDEVEVEDFLFEVEEPSIIPKKIYKKELFELQVELLKLQEWLKLTDKTVVVVFEGRDSAGKGATIKKFVENLNPRYYNVIALGVPTDEERKDWFGRYKKQIRPGMINLFDRSWYNRGLIEPVMGYATKEEYKDFMANVEGFENELISNGNYLFKLWFSIEKETQAQRFEMRKSSPLKYWKYSPNDSKMQDMWDKFTEYKEKLFDKTSTENHPWVIIDGKDKRVSGLNAIRYVLKNITYTNKDEEKVSPEYPEVLTVLKP
jgi:polyphosphate kinase 2